MEGILAAMSQFDNEQRAERTRVGLRASAQMGRWVFKRPLGYLNSPRVKRGPSLATDTERAPLIRKAFELCAEGRSEHEVLATITAMGLRTEEGNRISKQFLAKILRNPTYAGWISYKPLGERYRGDFQPLVSQELVRRGAAEAERKSDDRRRQTQSSARLLIEAFRSFRALWQSHDRGGHAVDGGTATPTTIAARSIPV